MIHLVTLDYPPGFEGGIATWSRRPAAALHERGEPLQVYARWGRETEAFDRGEPYPIRRLWGRSWARLQGLWVLLQVRPRLRRGDHVICATWPLAASSPSSCLAPSPSMSPCTDRTSPGSTAHLRPEPPDRPRALLGGQRLPR